MISKETENLKKSLDKMAEEKRKIVLTKQEAIPIFEEETKKFGLENIKDFRIGGYRKGPLDLWSTYCEELEDGYFITIDDRVNSLKKFKRMLRHELGHIKHPSYLGCIYARLVEYLPLEKWF